MPGDTHTMKRLNFDGVVGGLYEVALDPSGWGSVIQDIGALVNATGGGQFHIWDGKGQSLKEIAADHGVAVSTIRSQLKQVFAKTATRKQAELASLLRCVTVFQER